MTLRLRLELRRKCIFRSHFFPPPPGLHLESEDIFKKLWLRSNSPEFPSSLHPLPSKTKANSRTCSWYAVYNVYSVHRFVLNWATALNATSSQTAIIDVVKPRIPNTTTMVMVALIAKYGINKNADTALINMLQIPTKKPQPTYGNGRLRGESSTLPASMWQPLLVARLQDALQIVMDDFNDFISAVGNGTFSTNGLASAKALKKKMAGTSPSGNASMVSTHKTLVSAHKATASLHASDSPHSLAAAHVIPSPHTTRATLSTHTSASTLATVSARRPEGESTGP